MLALSVQQPYSWAILRGGKTVENRRNKRGPGAARATFNRPGARIALHAGQRYAGPEAHRFVANVSGVPIGDPGGPRSDTAWAFGAFIGLVTIESVHLAEECYDPASGRLCSPWAEEHAAHLVLADPLVLHRPVPAPGRLGLWSVDDATVVAQIRRQAS